MADNVKYLDDENFSNAIEKGVVLVDFFADWCGPCKMMDPIVHEFANQMGGKMTVAKLDIESSQKTTAEFHVTSIPTMILFKDGKEVERIIGVKDLDGIQSLVSPHL